MYSPTRAGRWGVAVCGSNPQRTDPLSTVWLTGSSARYHHYHPSWSRLTLSFSGTSRGVPCRRVRHRLVRGSTLFSVASFHLVGYRQRYLRPNIFFMITLAREIALVFVCSNHMNFRFDRSSESLSNEFRNDFLTVQKAGGS